MSDYVTLRRDSRRQLWQFFFSLNCISDSQSHKIQIFWDNAVICVKRLICYWFIRQSGRSQKQQQETYNFHLFSGYVGHQTSPLHLLENIPLLCKWKFSLAKIPTTSSEVLYSWYATPSQVPQLTWIAVGWGTWHQTENFLLFLLYLEGEPLKTQTWIPWTMKPAQKKLQANLVWEVVSIKSMNIAFENIDQLKSRQAHFLSSDMPIVEKPTFFMVQANLILLTCPLKKRLLCCYNLFVQSLNLNTNIFWLIYWYWLQRMYGHVIYCRR